ncbi:anaphase promoting complex subunit 5 [Neopestalotiopsis sp. 37M]|nr:anaphase promoting complex subunit 5 [Neopestalotiopsis sp. 37M]
MSRFLTPAKIGLLALIELYVEKAVPISAMVDVLSFVTSHLMDADTRRPANGSSHWAKAENTVRLVISIADFEKVLGPHAAASGIPGRSLWYVFLDKLWKINSLDALHEFFERREQLLVKTKEEQRREVEMNIPQPSPEVILLSRNSPFGAFVRRTQLEFSRLRFEHTYQLWKDFVKYRQTTAAYYRKKTPSFQRLSFDNVLLEGEHTWGSGLEAIANVAYGDMLRNDPASTLPSDFGCYKEAIAAMLETVSTARENRDMTCLNFALNWLFHFSRAHPEVTRELDSNNMLGDGKESLAFLRAKAKETGMWTLWSSALVSEAKMSLANGDSIAVALEHMVRSSQILVERNMKSMMGSQMSLNIALWDRLGVSYLSTTTCEVFLRCHARHSVFDDELKVTSRIASMLAFRGKYDEALERLESLDPNSLRSWKPSQYWHKFRGIIKLRQDIHRNNLDGAEHLLSQLLQNKQEDLEPDLAFVIENLHIECLTRRGDLKAAFEKVEALISELRDENSDIALRVRLLLIKADLLDRCGRPQKGFTIAVRAANVAWRARLIPFLWPAIGAISNILVSLGDFEPAIQLLTAVLPRSLECENSAMTAKLYSVLGDANMGMAGKMAPKSNKRREYMTKAVEAIQKAFDHYSNVQDIMKQCEMMAKKATIMRVAGEYVLANDYAAAYLALRRDAAQTKV